MRVSKLSNYHRVLIYRKTFTVSSIPFRRCNIPLSRQNPSISSCKSAGCHISKCRIQYREPFPDFSYLCHMTYGKRRFPFDWIFAEICVCNLFDICFSYPFLNSFHVAPVLTHNTSIMKKTWNIELVLSLFLLICTSCLTQS